MDIIVELTNEEQRACDLVGNDFASWLNKKAIKMMKMVTETAKQKVLAGKTLIEIEDILKK